MSRFVRIGDGVDVVPLAMAVERLGSVFGEKSFCELFATGDWTGEYFAFPQLRNILLDIMRRVECGVLQSVFLARPMKVVGLSDATQGYVFLAITPCGLRTSGEELPVPAGGVVFSAGAEGVEIFGPESTCVLVMNFAPMP